MNTPADLEPNAPCRDGAAILMQYGDVHHIAYVTSVTETEVCFREANYKPNQETFRCLSHDDRELRKNEAGESCWFPG